VGGNLSEDDEPGWVMGTISKMVQYRMQRVRQKQMKLEELTQPGWGDAADYFYERDKMYGTTELKVPAVVQPQRADDAALSVPTTSSEPLETLDRVHRKLQMPQVSSRPVSSHRRCKDAYASVRRYMDMVANVDSSEYICRRVDVKVRLSLEI